MSTHKGTNMVANWLREHKDFVFLMNEYKQLTKAEVFKYMKPLIGMVTPRGDKITPSDLMSAILNSRKGNEK